MSDPYSLLGLKREDRPTEYQIRAAYRKKAQTLHPDKGGTDTAAFQKVTEAYKLLSYSNRRTEYDRQFEPANSVTDLFLRNFKARGMLEIQLPSPPAAQVRGNNVAIMVKVPAKVLLHGGQLKLPLSWISPTFEVEIEIAPGEAQMRVCTRKGFGGRGKNKGTNGDLIVIISPERTI